MKALCLVLLGVSALLLSGCNDHGSAPLAAPAVKGAGAVRVTVKWPQRKGKRGRYIP